MSLTANPVYNFTESEPINDSGTQLAKEIASAKAQGSAEYTDAKLLELLCNVLRSPLGNWRQARLTLGLCPAGHGRWSHGALICDRCGPGPASLSGTAPSASRYTAWVSTRDGGVDVVEGTERPLGMFCPSGGIDVTDLAGQFSGPSVADGIATLLLDATETADETLARVIAKVRIQGCDPF